MPYRMGTSGTEQPLPKSVSLCLSNFLKNLQIFLYAFLLGFQVHCVGFMFPFADFFDFLSL